MAARGSKCHLGGDRRLWLSLRCLPGPPHPLRAAGVSLGFPTHSSQHHLHVRVMAPVLSMPDFLPDSPWQCRAALFPFRHWKCHLLQSVAPHWCPDSFTSPPASLDSPVSTSDVLSCHTSTLFSLPASSFSIVLVFSPSLSYHPFGHILSDSHCLIFLHHHWCG